METLRRSLLDLAARHGFEHVVPPLLEHLDSLLSGTAGELDLHTFQPRDLGSLLPDYFAECQKRGILSVRVIHGKGTGALREGVHRLLPKLAIVESWTWPAAESYGGWGATWVRLKGP